LRALDASGSLTSMDNKSKEGKGAPHLSSEIEEILWRMTGKDSEKA